MLNSKINANPNEFNTLLRTRVIPCLLLKNRGFYKTVRFRNPSYLGDPINILKIFNEKEVDEILILDIGATASQQSLDYNFLRDFASECFMPLGYGGGIQNLEQIKTLFNLGFEKVSINSASYSDPDVVSMAADRFGSQSIVVSIDAKKNIWGQYEVYTRSGTRKTGRHPGEFAQEMEKRGAGEILINSINRDGAMIGFDLKLIKIVTSAVKIPVIACGGAGNIDHLAEAVHQGGANAVAAGSMFVYQGPHKAVLINFPKMETIEKIMK